MDMKAKEESEKTFLAIGRFIFEFSQLEYEIRFRLANEVLSDDVYFNEIMVHDFSALCRASFSVFKYAYSNEPDRFKDIEALLKKALALSDIRNAVAHGLWMPFMEGGKVIHVPRSQKPRVSVEQAETLEKKADQALALRVAIASVGDADFNENYKTGGNVWK